MEKIDKITLNEKRTREFSSCEIAQIDSNGKLQVDGQDLGEGLIKFWGENEYEYWVIVEKDWKDTILLLLIKEQFENLDKFREWLNWKNIPNKFGSI